MRRGLGSAVGCVALLVPIGCHGQGQLASGRFTVPLTADDPEPAIVATVDGRPIRASDVATQARARGVSAREALSDLVDAEALISEAARRSLDKNPEVERAARAEAVRRLLATTFERDVRPDAVPTRDVKRTYNLNKNLLDHSEYVDVWHVLVPVKKDAKPELRSAARALAESLAARAKETHSAEAFQELAKTSPPPGIDPLRAEHIVTARDGWTMKTFSYPAFELTRPGEISNVVETDYGYHIIYLNRRIPETHVPFAQAEPNLRLTLFPEFRKREFVRYADALRGQHAVQVFPERLER